MTLREVLRHADETYLFDAEVGRPFDRLALLLDNLSPIGIDLNEVAARPARSSTTVSETAGSCFCAIKEFGGCYRTLEVIQNGRVS